MTLLAILLLVVAVLLIVGGVHRVMAGDAPIGAVLIVLGIVVAIVAL